MLEQNKQMEAFITNRINYYKSDEGSGVINTTNPFFYKCDFDSKSLTMEFVVSEWSLNPNKAMHGGIIATCFDNTFGTLSFFFADGKFIATTNLNINYLKPIFEGDSLMVNVKVTSLGKRMISLTGEAVSKKNNKLIATASASFIIIDKKNS